MEDHLIKTTEALKQRSITKLNLARFNHKAYMHYGDDPTDEQLLLIKSEVTKEIYRLNPRVEITENDLNYAFGVVMNYITSCRTSRQYWDKISKPQSGLQMTSIQFREFAISRAKEKCERFTLNHTNSEVFDTLCKYFSNEQSTPWTFKDFTGKSKVMDPGKGLLIYGRVGCGKTFLMETMQRNPKCTFAVRGCPEISFEYAKEGIDRIEFYSNEWKTYRNEFGQTTTGICFDDLGTENERRHYGDKLDVIADIIASRYRKRQLWSQTFITTNLTAKGITDAYGDRLSSRFSEMFNIITFPKEAIDWRKL